MGYSGQFERFDPFKTLPPNEPFPTLPRIVERARRLLPGFTIEEVTSVALGIDRAIREYFRLAAERGSKRHGYESPDGQGDASTSSRQIEFHDGPVADAENTRSVDALRLCRRPDSGVTEPTLREYALHHLLAVLALWFLADACDALYTRIDPCNDQNPIGHRSDEDVTVESAGESIIYLVETPERLAAGGEAALCALEAVLIAEVDQLSDNWADVYSELISGQREHLERERETARAKRAASAQKANVARHRKRLDAKALVTSAWEKEFGRWSSAAKAGLHFADWLAEKGHTFEPSTVTKWIREHAKLRGIRLR